MNGLPISGRGWKGCAKSEVPAANSIIKEIIRVRFILSSDNDCFLVFSLHWTGEFVKRFNRVSKKIKLKIV